MSVRACVVDSCLFQLARQSAQRIAQESVVEEGDVGESVEDR